MKGLNGLKTAAIIIGLLMVSTGVLCLIPYTLWHFGSATSSDKSITFTPYKMTDNIRETAEGGGWLLFMGIPMTTFGLAMRIKRCPACRHHSGVKQTYCVYCGRRFTAGTVKWDGSKS